MQCKVSDDTNLDEVPRPQKRQCPKSIIEYKNTIASRNEATNAAYRFSGFSMSEIAISFDLYYSPISKIIKMAGDSPFKT